MNKKRTTSKKDIDEDANASGAQVGNTIVEAKILDKNDTGDTTIQFKDGQFVDVLFDRNTRYESIWRGKVQNVCTVFGTTCLVRYSDGTKEHYTQKYLTRLVKECQDRKKERGITEVVTTRLLLGECFWEAKNAPNFIVGQHIEMIDGKEGSPNETIYGGKVTLIYPAIECLPSANTGLVFVAFSDHFRQHYKQTYLQMAVEHCQNRKKELGITNVVKTRLVISKRFYGEGDNDIVPCKRH